MANAPSKNKDIVVGYDILINGKAVSDEIPILDIEVARSVNRVATARITLQLPVGDGNDRTFALSEAADFIPGQPIEIKVGAYDDKKTIFKGIIVFQGLQNLGTGRNELTVKCSDEAVKLSYGNANDVYENQKDTAILSSIIQAAGLQSSIDSTSVQHKILIRYQSSDWDFLLARAKANGLLVYTEDGAVNIKKPATSGPSIDVDFENDVLEYQIGFDARYQLQSVSGSAWSHKDQALKEGKSQEPSLNKQGNLDAKTLGGKLGLKDHARVVGGPVDTEELKAYANARLLFDRMHAYQGEITCFGIDSPKINTIMTINGFGDRFNKDALITSVIHKVRSGVWRTTIGFGLPADWNLSNNSISGEERSLLPGIFGLQNGTVKQIDTDPDGESRIKVLIPGIQKDKGMIWARMAHEYATKNKGSFFLPEIEDEVVVGFFGNDPRYPVILGMLYSSKNKPPYTAEKTNKIKAIVTKNDLCLEMNDTDKVITVKTPGGNQIVLSDKDKSILLKDQSGNKIEMSAGGITINSAKDITIKATGKISMEGPMGVAVKADAGDLNFQGLNVNAKANIAFAAEGTASAKLSASGMLTIQGSLVKIN